MKWSSLFLREMISSLNNELNGEHIDSRESFAHRLKQPEREISRVNIVYYPDTAINRPKCFLSSNNIGCYHIDVRNGVSLNETKVGWL